MARGIGKLFGFVILALALVFFFFLMKNGWDIPAAVNGILSIFGK
ncbi:MAG: hypothetical protein ABIC04_07490 [Nanoarchaeota archaeon]